MSNELDQSAAVQTPTLTLNPFEDVAPAPAVPKPVEEEPIMKENVLSPEEKAQAEAFAKQIDLHNSQTILLYGAGTQKKMSDFSDGALSKVATKDLGEVGTLLTNVVQELREFNEEEEKGVFGLFKKQTNKLAAMKAKYAKAETNINSIVKTLETHRQQLIKDAAMLDILYNENLLYYKELTMYIMAGKIKLADVRQNELAQLVAKAEQSGLAEDVQAAKDLDNMCTRFEKKLYDLELTRQISIQTGPQIRLVQENDTIMAEKIQSTLVNTIPLWKSQMVLALGVYHSQQAAEAQREVTNMTNELLKKNADTLKMATVETAKESERGIVDMETLKHTNESLIQTFDEVLKIQAEGREKRQVAEEEMRKMELELKNKLLEIRR